MYECMNNDQPSKEPPNEARFDLSNEEAGADVEAEAEVGDFVDENDDCLVKDDDEEDFLGGGSSSSESSSSSCLVCLGFFFVDFNVFDLFISSRMETLFPFFLVFESSSSSSKSS